VYKKIKKLKSGQGPTKGCTRGADKSWALKRKQEGTGLKKKIYLLYIFPPELHTLMTSLF
jgi:hypothetical protein